MADINVLVSYNQFKDLKSSSKGHLLKQLAKIWIRTVNRLEQSISSYIIIQIEKKMRREDQERKFVPLG